MTSTDMERAATVGWRRILVEHRRPPSIASRPNAYWLVLLTVCIGAFMSQLDASIVTVAFPTLQRSFHASLGAVTWVGLSYLLALVGLVTGIGRMADMVGRKLLYMYGFVVFAAGSALCGLAPNLVVLDGFRILQGFGAAMIQANSVAILVLALPREKLGRGIGIQGAAQALGLALGPTVGGLLIALGGWRLIFFVNVPVGMIGAVMAWFLVPRSRHLQARVPFDWPGLALFVPAVAALLSALSFGDKVGWTSPIIIGLLSGTLVLGATFVRRERRTTAPMLDLTLFKRIPFAAGITSGLLSYSVLFGTLFVVPFYFERALHQSTSRSGLTLGVMPDRSGDHRTYRWQTGRAAGSATPHGRRHGDFGGDDGCSDRRSQLVAHHHDRTGNPRDRPRYVHTTEQRRHHGARYPRNSPVWPVACSTRPEVSARRWAWHSPVSSSGWRQDPNTPR